MPSSRPTDPDARQGDDGPGARGLAELKRRGALRPPARIPQRRSLDGLSLSELADELGALHGGPAYQGEDT